MRLGAAPSGPALAQFQQTFAPDEAGALSFAKVRRRGRCRDPKRGLPADQDLNILAGVYLKQQGGLWPELVADGSLPEPSPSVIDAMVHEFKAKWFEGRMRVCPAHPRVKAFAAAYVRYSCDNSTPRSLDDQLVNELKKAHQDKRFIPWSYVFADASVTGTSRVRTGYLLLQAALASEGFDLVDTVYVDDFGRASRDILESFRLVKFMTQHDTRLVGVSDGFDSATPEANIRLLATAMFNDMFIAGLRKKVLRGMNGAATRQTGLGRPPFGYKLVPKLDPSGRPMINAKGKQVKVYEIDPEQAPVVQRIFRLYGLEGRSQWWIARHMNGIKAGGSDRWTDHRVHDLLTRTAYIGVWIFNRTRQIADTETGAVKVEENPRDQWNVTVRKDLRIVSDDLWKAVCRRAYAWKAANPARRMAPGSKNRFYPTTLFSGTLFCGYCGNELLLLRSAPDYKVMACNNGVKRSHGCKLSCSKSTRIIEQALLGALAERVLTPGNLALLVEKANVFLAQEANKPVADTAPWTRQVAETRATIERLVRLVELDSAGAPEALLARIKALEGQKASLQKLIREADARRAQRPEPLTLERVLPLLEDLRGLLNQDIPEAAQAIRRLTGPITVTQQARAKRGADWFAEFKGNLLPLLASAARGKGCSDSSSLEYLLSRNWTMPLAAIVEVDAAAGVGLWLEAVRPLHAAGMAPGAIAAAAGVPAQFVRRACRWLDPQKAGAGVTAAARPDPDGVEATRRHAGHPKAAEVVRLRDERRYSFCQVSAELGVARCMVPAVYYSYLLRRATEGGDPAAAGPWR